jgi:hypothetical protein
MVAADRRIQREGGGTDVVSYRLRDLSAELRGVGSRSQFASANHVFIRRNHEDSVALRGGPNKRIPVPPEAKEDPNQDSREPFGIKAPTRDLRETAVSGRRL